MATKGQWARTIAQIAKREEAVGKERDDQPELRSEWPVWKAVKLLWSAYVVGGKVRGV